MNPSSTRIDVLVFELCQKRFALLLSQVQEVLRSVAIAPLPNAPSAIEGLINVRGSLVPVFNLRHRFGLPAKAPEPGDHLIVARAQGRVVAVRVDHVMDIHSFEAREIEEAKRVVPEADYVAGVVKASGGLLLIHDLQTFLSGSESEALDRALGDPG
ncbi:MAG: purine-binding chemotaxis protein CheW [Planctomycetes bacterium]|nr:purine-binding chemotaxis protein CheW [Planctomycetota bacterium]